MRVAIVHYWLLGMRGGERVVEALCRLLPDADVFTLFYEPGRVSESIRAHRIRASFLNPLRDFYRSLLPLTPLALESFDLRGYDLVVSSESGPAKGVLVPSATRHVCYCHSPMRYLWDLYPAYLHEWTRGRIKRAVMAPLANFLRMWDYTTAARVDEFIANSRNVQQRIWRVYRRESKVIHPPVAVESFHSEPAEDYYLIASELVAYKRVDLAVRAFARNGRRLRVAGNGPEYKRLRRLATKNIEFCGWVPDGELRELFARCRAFVMPGEEDFGIAPVEALAAGKPVIALGRGGVLETIPVESPVGGVLFDEPTVEQLQAAIERLEKLEGSIQAGELKAHAAQFCEGVFARKMREVLGVGEGLGWRAEAG